MADHVFPDANDRTPNDPCVLLSWASVQRLYYGIGNGSLEDGGPVLDKLKLKAFIQRQAAENDWDEVEFLGKQVLLKKTLGIRHPSTSPNI